jgi:hypothetical protein
MANWGPYGAQGELFECMAKHGPPLPDGVPSPREWGLEEVVHERLGPYASQVHAERVKVRFEFDSFQHAMQTFGSAGPSAAARAAMTDEQRQALLEGALAVMQRHNQAADGRIVVEPEYLQVVARKRG